MTKYETVMTTLHFYHCSPMVFISNVDYWRGRQLLLIF